MSRRVRRMSVADVAGDFELVSYWHGPLWNPAVYRAQSGFEIRVLKSMRIVGDSHRYVFDYIVTDGWGLVTRVPIGWAKEYKPCRIIDIETVAAEYKTPRPDAQRIA